MNPIKILVADDHSIVRLGLTALFRYEKDFAVVGEASDGEEAVQKARTLQPDIVIMDLVMPSVDGVEATARIRRDRPQTRVLILTTYGSSVDVGRAIDAGAAGALLKDGSNEDLVSAIRKIAAGETVLARDVMRELNAERETRKLTPRQLEVLSLVVKGYTNPDIARLFDISTDAVKQHVSAICERLGAATRAEAAAIAIHRQLLKI